MSSICLVTLGVLLVCSDLLQLCISNDDHVVPNQRDFVVQYIEVLGDIAEVLV